MARRAAEQLRQEGLDVRFLQLDVADDANANAAATSLAGQTDHLDVLVNNAGVALEGMDGVIKPSTLEMAKLKATYEVNVFGPGPGHPGLRSVASQGTGGADRDDEQRAWLDRSASRPERSFYEPQSSRIQ